MSHGFNEVTSRRRETKARLIACIAVLLTLLTSAVAGFETDQYSVPVGREFADLRFYFSHKVYEHLVSAVDKINARIERSQRAGHSVSKIERHQSPHKITRAVWLEFPFLIYQTQSWELAIRSKEMHSQYPGLMTEYLPANYMYYHWALVINPIKIIRLVPSPTIMVNGTYFGTDKIAHFFDEGYIYYSTYRNAREDGLNEAESTRRAVSKAAGTFRIWSEHTFSGNFLTGVRSNADLAANYAGLKFYRNLTEEVRIQGELLPPMLVRDGAYWRLNDQVKPLSDFFSIFITDHFDEALNPNIYSIGTGMVIRKQICKRCDDLRLWYRDREGNPRTRKQFMEITEELGTYFGEDYGYYGSQDERISIANVCFTDNPFDDIYSRENNMTLLGENYPEISTPYQLTSAGVFSRSIPLNGAVVNAADRLARTQIWWAARYGQIDQVKRLISMGADINAADVDGDTPLHAAVRWGHAETVELLLKHGVDINAATLYGFTPLHLVSRELRDDVFEILLNHGADPDARDIFGCTPLHDIAARGDEKMAARLIAAGANLMVKNIHGSTPLHHAARSGHVEMVADLLSLGADITIQNSMGKTPVDEAIQAKNEAVLNYLSPQSHKKSP